MMCRLAQGDLYGILSQLMKKKKPQFEIDLRVEGESQDAILQDEEKRKEINEKLELFKWDQAQNPFVTICRSVI